MPRGGFRGDALSGFGGIGEQLVKPCRAAVVCRAVACGTSLGLAVGVGIRLRNMRLAQVAALQLEKTHAGTLVEIALARTLRLADGMTLDYTIAGADVDCKFSHRLGGWMIPPEADGKLMLLVQASDEDGTWSAGLLRATGENLSSAGNRDGKRALNERGRAAVRWLHTRAPLQENALITLPERDAAAIFAQPSGQQRVNEL